MIVNYVQLRNFRNFAQDQIDFSPKLNIIIGNNAQGKTNILESLYFLSTSKSHRCFNDQDLIKDSEQMSKITCLVEQTKLSACLHPKGKSLFINDNLIKKSSDFIGHLNVVLFAPSDVEIFSDTPKERRRFINIEIGKLSISYMNALLEYNQLLKQRNTALKKEQLNQNLLQVIQDKMIQQQYLIVQQRKDFISYLNNKLNDYYQKLANTQDCITLEYQSHVLDLPNFKESYQALYQRYLTKDVIYNSTSIGIHRDDVIFYVNGKKALKVISQGQKRMIIIALKLALVNYIQDTKKINPILLLDDINSELDQNKRKNLFNLLPKNLQTIITMTAYDQQITGNYRLLEIENGHLKTVKEV